MLTLAAMPGHAQKWVKLDEGLQYDTQSLRVNGSLRQIWVQMDLAPDREGDDAPVTGKHEGEKVMRERICALRG